MDTQTQIVVGVELSNSGSDQGQLVPMLEQLQQRYGRIPGESLADGGFAALKEIVGGVSVNHHRRTLLLQGFQVAMRSQRKTLSEKELASTAVNVAAALSRTHRTLGES